MQDHGAALELQQQIFGAPADRHDPLSGQLPGQLRFDGPTQPVLVNAQLADALAARLAFDAAPRGFDLG